MRKALVSAPTRLSCPTLLNERVTLVRASVVSNLDRGTDVEKAQRMVILCSST